VLAGEFAGARGPARTFTPITMLDAHLLRGEILRVPLPATQNALAVVAAGSVTAGGRTARAGELILFANDGAQAAASAEDDAHVILLAGEPIPEPIVQYGPFVMNSTQEIEQAILDVGRGGFGPLPE